MRVIGSIGRTLREEAMRQEKIAADGKVEMSIWTPNEKPIAEWPELVEFLIGAAGIKREWYTDVFRDCIYHKIKRTEVGKEKARLKRMRIPADYADLDLMVSINWTGDSCDAEMFPLRAEKQVAKKR